MGRQSGYYKSPTPTFAEKHETLLGVNTWESYQAVLDAIHAEKRPCDLIVATGDLAQDQSSAAYQHFAEGIASFSVPCVWLPGNHDFQPAMYSSLQEAGISPAKCVFTGTSGKFCSSTVRCLAFRTVS